MLLLYTQRNKREKVRIVREEIGKWFLDIAKYVVTAGLISSLFGDVESKLAVYVLGTIIVVSTFLLGLSFLKEEKKVKTKKINNYGCLFDAWSNWFFSFGNVLYETYQKRTQIP